MKFTRILAVLLCGLFLLTACSFWKDSEEKTYTKPDSGESLRESDQNENKESGTLPEHIDPPEEKFTIFEDMSALGDLIVAAEGISGFSESGYVGCQILFNSSAKLQISADIILPKDYTTVQYPVILYFSDKTTKSYPGPDAAELAKTYCANGAIVVRIHPRGTGNSKGASNAWGKDFADVTTLLTVLEKSTFLKDSPVYAVGSGIGSIAVLRLAATDTGNRVRGCAVTNPIADLKAYVDSADEASVEYMMQLLQHASYDKKPEEYQKRSAVTFANEIRVPLLIVNSKTASDVYSAQAKLLTDKLTEAKKNWAVVVVSSDTTGSIADDMVSAVFNWIKPAD